MRSSRRKEHLLTPGKHQITLVSSLTKTTVRSDLRNKLLPWHHRQLTAIPCDMKAESVPTTTAVNFFKWRKIIWQESHYFSILKLLWVLDDSAFWKLGSLVWLFLFIWLGQKPVMTCKTWHGLHNIATLSYWRHKGEVWLSNEGDNGLR